MVLQRNTRSIKKKTSVQKWRRYEEINEMSNHFSVGSIFMSSMNGEAWSSASGGGNKRSETPGTLLQITLLMEWYLFPSPRSGWGFPKCWLGASIDNTHFFLLQLERHQHQTVQSGRETWSKRASPSPLSTSVRSEQVSMWTCSSCFGTRWRALNGQDCSSLASLGWFCQWENTGNISFQSKPNRQDSRQQNATRMIATSLFHGRWAGRKI